MSFLGIGAQGRNRTTDTAIFSRMLYQLSYLGISKGPRKRRRAIERAVYSGPKRRCLPRFAFGYARRRRAKQRRSAPGVARRAKTGRPAKSL
jgi:hypothetical protein